ncbi:hypothetical protein [Streptomyces rochei]|uniref:hypothetical protein n=1 Tax=Streptomyces rochei TaxID=1928 RepID=UPI0035312B1D
MTRPIADLDVPASVVEADTRLQSLLAAPPNGHGPGLQPDRWYEQVFDLLASTHPDTCTSPPEETP